MNRIDIFRLGEPARRLSLLVGLVWTIWVPSYADSSFETKKEAALKGVAACVRRNEASSKECRSVNKNIEILRQAYRQGDKSVLPALLEFANLTDFFDEALLNDPEGFLSAVATLPKANQQAVARGLSGGISGLNRERFDSIRGALRNLPDSSPNRGLANEFLATLEVSNASYLVNYFPPGIFANRGGDFQVRWYSRELYGLGERPLWPVSEDAAVVYRLTILPAFSKPRSVSLIILPDGTGNISSWTIDSKLRHRTIEQTLALDQKQIANFLADLDQSNFWELPTEESKRGFDGGDWIMEGVRNGSYHVVVRWCPNKTPFGKLSQKLFELAHSSYDGC